MSATKEQLLAILEDVSSLGYDLSDADDKSSLYDFIVQNGSSYTLDSGLVIESISIKYLFWLFNNKPKKGRLAPKA